MRAIKSLLCSVPGVSDVRRQHRSDDRIAFQFNGAMCTVHEMFGDNSRYWISSNNVNENAVDMAPIHDVFAALSSWCIFLEWLAWVAAALAIFFLVWSWV